MDFAAKIRVTAERKRLKYHRARRASGMISTEELLPIIGMKRSSLWKWLKTNADLRAKHYHPYYGAFWSKKEVDRIIEARKFVEQGRKRHGCPVPYERYKDWVPPEEKRGRLART